MKLHPYRQLQELMKNLSDNLRSGNHNQRKRAKLQSQRNSYCFFRRSDLVCSVRIFASFCLQSSIFLWSPERRISGTFLFSYTGGFVYCGYSRSVCRSPFSSLFSEKDSLRVASVFKTPPTSRITASVISIAGISPPVTTKSPIVITSST